MYSDDLYARYPRPLPKALPMAVTARYHDPDVMSALQWMRSEVIRMASQRSASCEFWKVFGAHAHAIESLAGPAGWPYVQVEFEKLLDDVCVDAIPAPLYARIW